MPNNPKIVITDYRQAYYFRKAMRKKGWMQERLKKVSNRSLMYALTFYNRVN